MPDPACFHCALPIPPACELTVDVDGVARPVCCPGCRAVCELIVGAGMQGWYALRDAPVPGTGRPEVQQAGFAAFNAAVMLDEFTSVDGNLRAASVYVGGMYCSACSWLISTAFDTVAGVHSADVNPVSHRVRIRFDPVETGLGDLLARIAALGYRPQPLSVAAAARPEVAEQRAALKRLVVASLGMMQVMMFAIGLYAGAIQGMDETMQRFLRFVSFVVATPVVLYSGRPFFDAAWRGLRARRPGMDVPVALAVGAAYVASVVSTLRGGASVWFDSVTMFVFFLTVGRYLEMRARHRSVDHSTALAALLPGTAVRLGVSGPETVPLGALRVADRLRIGDGDIVPADGHVVAGNTEMNEAVLSGESRPVQRGVGDRVVAGSMNVGNPVDVIVDRTGADTAVGIIGRLAEQARFARPQFVQLADRIAGVFVVAILVIAAAVAVTWAILDPARAFEVTLAVLVVTCPCALALATPAAYAAAAGGLAGRRVLLVNGNALQVLAGATRVVFDKTGTLTAGVPRIVDVRLHRAGIDVARARRLAAALEAHSTHPLARAFTERDAAGEIASELRSTPGGGLSGMIDGRRWRLGSAAFVGVQRNGGSAGDSRSRAWLADDDGVVAEFLIDDPLRPDAAATVAALRDLGLRCALLSGDTAGAVSAVASQLGIDDAAAECSPADKVSRLQELQANGDVVAMVGDGINDGPVLAAADVSIAPAHATALARTHADLIVATETLQPVATAIRRARATRRIVRQNLAWAACYNLAALPLAAAGLVPPWAAAIGMSGSSLIVVLNALRLARGDTMAAK